jgi:isoleucyl-tRNA synthetase
VLVQLSQIMAPFTPFLAEELYQKLTGGESVHLLDWPAAGHVNELVVGEMETVREYVNQGLSIRAKERLKVRQPLASVTVPTLGQFVSFEDILTEELNVKAVQKGKELSLDLHVTPELKREGLMREVVRFVQNARKQAGLNVDDRIKLSLVTSESDLKKAISEYADTITAETLAEALTEVEYDYSVDLKVEGMPLKISLQKA